MSVHAVLDSSLGRVLDAWELVERETGLLSTLRFSIVHADQASLRNIERIAALGAGVMVQNRMNLQATDYVTRLGARRSSLRTADLADACERRHHWRRYGRDTSEPFLALGVASRGW